MSNVLFIIDPQNDFIDAPEKSGSLAVPGSFDDMVRLAKYIEENNIDDIAVSLDTHSRMDIAHSAWWVNEKGENPAPFTMITLDDFQKGTWKPVSESEVENTYNYLKALSDGGKKTLVVWPDHCIKDTWGNDVTPVLNVVLKDWEKKNNKKVSYFRKGENPNTEHYSAVKAEVVMDDGGYSDVNHELMKFLSKSDNLIIAGEAQSHCVADTVYDIQSVLKSIHPDKKVHITVLSNCMSPVTGFEENAKKFMDWVSTQDNMSEVTVKMNSSMKNKF